MFVFNSAEGLHGAHREYLNVDNPKFKEVFLLKLNHSSEGKNVQDAHHSNLDGFVGRDVCFSMSGEWVSLE